MKILIISQEVWRDDTNGGNVLSNIFDGMEAEFAQIYCSPGTPSNGICKRYYQMTDIMVINNILRKLPIGKIVKYENFQRIFKNLTIWMIEIRDFIIFLENTILKASVLSKKFYGNFLIGKIAI